MSNLMRHHAMDTHKDAVMSFLGMPAKYDEFRGSPRLEEFKAVFDAISTGTAPSAGIDGVGDKNKIVKMTFCLAEALTRQDRAFMRDALMSSHRRDESGGRLAIRCSATTSSLACRVFHQSTQRHFGTGATNITMATEKAWREFATVNYGCPRPKQSIGIL
eukprot:8018073-Pyramimonas_sp.AAC.1